MGKVLNLLHGTSRLLVLFVVIIAAYAAHFVAIVGVAPSIVNILLGRIFCDIFYKSVSLEALR